jgi:hypothetical protein
MTDEFQLGEINSSAAYRLAREVVIPRLRAEVFPAKGSEPFSLRDEIYAILADEVAQGRLTEAQLDSVARVRSSGGNATLAALTRFYVLTMLKTWGEIMSTDVRGMFVLTDAAAEEEQEDEEEEADGEVIGCIYAYTFPSVRGALLKVGKASGDVHQRVLQQLGTANPEHPEILKVWTHTNVGAMEGAIHSILKARGKWVESPRAREWFRTSVEEIDAIIRFVKD